MNLSTRQPRSFDPIRSRPGLGRYGLITVLSTGILICGAAQAERPATYWTKQTGDFFGFSNWNFGMPGPNLDARIDNGGLATISTEAFESIPYVYLGSQQNTTGTLEITSGGVARFTTMIVGALNATGNLRIREGGQLISFGGPIGSDYLGIGHVTVDGAGSAWSMTGSQMVVGGNGTGNVTVQDGGSISVQGGAGKIQLGIHPLSEGNLYIGNGGAAGVLSASEIFNGEGRGTVIFDHTEQGYEFGVKMTGLKTVNGYLNVRHEGSGTTILSAPENNLAGTVTVAGGTLLIAGNVVGSLREVVISDPDLGDTLGTEKTTGKFEVLKGGTLGGTGFIEGETNVIGTLSPGMGVGILSFGGNLNLAVEADTQDPNAPFGTGTVKIEIGGTVRGVGFDGIDVAGSLLYAGTLNIVLLDGFEPGDGATFDLFDGFESYQGTFEHIVFSSDRYVGEFDPQSGILSVATVPEPSALGLAVVGLVSLGLKRRRNANISAL